ncbi:MAG: NUDIX hydrolase [Ferroplasma sp.]
MDRLPRVAIGGVIVNDGMVLLAKRRDEPDKGKWAIPGGKLKLNETLSEGLIREIKEETKLNVTVGRLLGITESISKHFHYIIFDYLCTVISGQPEASSDATDLKYFKMDELDNSVNESTREFISKMADGNKTIFISKINL